MCGIVGYVGKQKASPVLIEGLKKLEYRGYDSAGIATLEEKEICCIKNKGRVKSLEDLKVTTKLNGTLGIAHTRWATHGKPSTENSHPHLSNDKMFAVVHNGIIENYNELREFLIENGYKFYSQTDTEVIPNLIQYYYEMEKDILSAIKRVCDKLKGSYALEIISKYDIEKIIVTRRNSPLVVGKGKDENYISSDIPAILSNTRDFYFLDDNQYAIITYNNVVIYDNDLKEVSVELKNINWDITSADKGEFEDYMLKEIFEQPKTIRNTVSFRLPLKAKSSLGDDVEFSKEYLESLNKIYIVACGTAMHAGLVGKNAIEKICRIPVEVEVASEFRYRNPIIDEKTLCIYISQSGETADTIAALKLAKEQGAKTLAISNVIGSSITREADYTIYTCAGPEIAVASTKAYTAQIVLLIILAINFAEILDLGNVEEISNLKKSIYDLPEKIKEVLENIELYKKIAKEYSKCRNMFFIGRGIDYAVVAEGSLKLKEITYIHSESYAAGELKHGPIALIEHGTPVISVITDEKLLEKTVSNIQEVVSRGASTLVITNKKIEKNNYDYVIEIPEISEYISPIISVIPMQLLSYYIAKEKKLDVDKPRNLAKSVTVE